MQNYYADLLSDNGFLVLALPNSFISPFLTPAFQLAMLVGRAIIVDWDSKLVKPAATTQKDTKRLGEMTRRGKSNGLSIINVK